ncbi:hypothetical protein Emag_005166 [Eimeria magna]
MRCAAGRAAAAALLLRAFCLSHLFEGIALVYLAAAGEAEAAGEPPSAVSVAEDLEDTADMLEADELGQQQQQQQQQQRLKGSRTEEKSAASRVSHYDSPLPLSRRSAEADEVDALLPPLEGFFLDEAPLPHQPSHRGSGEKYGRLLSKGNDLQGLPDTHPARVHADSRFARRKSFQLILAGIVLATAYLLSYYYHTWGSGVGTHAERHTFALNRTSSPTSALLLVMAWRLWLGLVVSGLVTLVLDAYRLESAISRRRRVISKRFINHWELLVGPPLLLLLLLSGRGTRQFPLESSSAIAGAKGVLGGTLARSGPAFESFMLDAVSQIPFGLAVVGIVELVFSLMGALLHARSQKNLIPVRRIAVRLSHDSDEGSTRAGSVAPVPVEPESPLDRTESRTQNSRRKIRRERSRRRRSQSSAARRLPSEEGRPQDREDSFVSSSRSRRSYNRRARTFTGRGHQGSHASVRPSRHSKRSVSPPVEEGGTEV